jgi:hypothetical protein
MTQISVTVKDEQVKAGLKSIGRAMPNIINENIEKVLKDSRDKVRKYPPIPKGSKYKRTYKFYEGVKIVKPKRTSAGGSWKRQGKLVAKARQKGRSYAVFVTGDSRGRGQALVHQKGYKGRKGWNVMANVVEKNSKNLVQKIQRDTKKQIRKAGLGR